MYCKSCGCELSDSEMFCGSCGAENDIVNSTSAPNSQEVSNVKANLSIESLIKRINALGKSKIIYFLSIGMMLLSMIFSVTPVFRVRAFLDNSDEVMFAGFFTFLIIAVYIVAIILMVTPFLVGKNPKPSYFICAKIITILTFVWFFILLFLTSGSVNKQNLNSVAGVAPSVTGWFYIITTAAAIALLFKLTYDIKKIYGIKTNRVEGFSTINYTEKENVWRCPQCGKANDKFISYCSCGCKKP